jgi:hypothetical protein
MNIREQWFIERVGKTVHRQLTIIGTEKEYRGTVLIKNEEHAKALCKMEKTEEWYKLEYVE